jgi:hypothetical protein
MGGSRRAAAVLLAGALVMMLAFAVSYVGAFHRPAPHRVPIALVAPAADATRTAAELNRLPGGPLRAHPVATLTSARSQIDGRQVYAAYDAETDTLYVADAANPATATAVTLTIDQVLAAQHQPAARVVDLKPLPASDPNGTVPFYSVIAWVFGGYLAAVLIGLAVGTRSSSVRRAIERIGALAAFALIGSLLEILILRTSFGVLHGHLLGLWASGMLIVLSSGLATAGLQALAGMAGTGLVILWFVIIGNASSGGPFARPLLPGFWRTVGGVLPPGAGIDLIRGVLFFGGSRILGPIVVLLCWLAGGGAIALWRGGRAVDPEEAEVELATAAAL